MINETLGKIDKMRIEVFETKQFQEPPSKTVYMQLNPEKYNIKSSVEYYAEQPSNASNTEQQYNRAMGDDVMFEFIFDSSGVVPPGKIVNKREDLLPIETLKGAMNSFNPEKAYSETKKSVEPDVMAFKELVMGYNGNTHQTAYLRLLWGNYKLDCRLKAIDIEYTLFRKDGTPVRAKVKCTFVETVSHNKRVAIENQSSPDLSHIRIMGMQEKLPLRCQEIYQNSQYYIQVAKANKLLSFRKLPIGLEIMFPPVK